MTPSCFLITQFKAWDALAFFLDGHRPLQGAHTIHLRILSKNFLASANRVSAFRTRNISFQGAAHHTPKSRFVNTLRRKFPNPGSNQTPTKLHPQFASTQPAFDAAPLQGREY